MFWRFKESRRLKKIYVVEDSESEQALLRLNLKLKNCAIQYFTSCESIIEEIMFNGRPDGVLVDYYLAGRTTGDKMVQFCKDNQIEALLVTGHEGDILGVNDCQIVRKSHDGSHYKLLNKWANEVLA